MDKRFLIVARVGDKSLHGQWLLGAEPEFDLFLSYFGDTPERFRADATFYDAAKGGKWPKIGDLVETYWDLIQTYEAVWFPDDDLLADAASINRLFQLFTGLGLSLAQPALSDNSHYTFAGLLQRPKSFLRYVNFVEVMAPIMSQSALQRLKHTFTQSPSGWGLDSLWPQLLGDSSNRQIAIVDAVSVIHTRPVGGELYKKNPDLSPKNDVEKLATLYPELNIDRRAFSNRFRVYETLQWSGCNSPGRAFFRGKWQKTWAHWCALFKKRYSPSPVNRVGH